MRLDGEYVRKKDPRNTRWTRPYVECVFLRDAHRSHKRRLRSGAFEHPYLLKGGHAGQNRFYNRQVG